jgi:hypothetical protein
MHLFIGLNLPVYILVKGRFYTIIQKKLLGFYRRSVGHGCLSVWDSKFFYYFEDWQCTTLLEPPLVPDFNNFE